LPKEKDRDYQVQSKFQETFRSVVDFFDRGVFIFKGADIFRISGIREPDTEVFVSKHRSA
jgi:hypothetical protein